MSEPTIAVRPPMPQECPQCGLLNPSTAIRCDCGYDLLSRPQSKAPVVGWRALLFSFDGRIGRATYWRFFGPYMAIGAALAFVDWLLDTRMTKGGGMFAVVFFVAALYPSIAASVKRCHDRDHSWLFHAPRVHPDRESHSPHRARVHARYAGSESIRPS